MKKEILYILLATALGLFCVERCGRPPAPPAAKTPAVSEPAAPIDNAPAVVANPPEPAPEVKTPEEPLPPPQLIVVDNSAAADAKKPSATLVAIEGGSSASAETGFANIEAHALQDTGKMVYVGEGCFIMGNPAPDAFDVESPGHEVCLKGFYLDLLEVEQKSYQRVMGANPSRFHGETLPVEGVSWHEASEYCRRLGKRLPTDAEWEFAARDSGRAVLWAGTSAIDELGRHAWYSENSGGRTHPVGSLRPNFLGLHDMSGNVREWVSDWYSSDYYSSGIKDNPAGPDEGLDKILRGGSWGDMPRYAQLAYRVHVSGDFRNSRNGFRCARD